MNPSGGYVENRPLPIKNSSLKEIKVSDRVEDKIEELIHEIESECSKIQYLYFGQGDETEKIPIKLDRETKLIKDTIFPNLLADQELMTYF